MRAVQVHGVNDVRIDSVPVPEPGPDDILVQVAACGICGTDLGYARAGGMPFGNEGPLPLGHEFAGTITATGSAVTALRVGQRVAINPTTPANYHGSGGPGAFADYILVRDAVAADTVHVLPDSLDFATAALAEPLAVALHGVNRSGAGRSSRVVVFGAGPIGLGVVAMLAQRGVADIVCIDRVDERLERARALGAGACFNPAREDIWQEIGERHGRDTLYGLPVVGTDQFIEVSGAPPVVPEIIANARFHAHLTVVAVHHQPVPVDLTMMLGKEMQLTTSMAYPTEFGEVLTMLAEGRIDTAPLVSHHFPFDRFDEAFGVAAQPAEAAKVMVTFP